MRRLICICMMLLCAGSVRGATINAATGSYLDVQAAVNLCVDGDIVQMPAGTNSWSTTLTNNGVTMSLIGAGPVVSCENDTTGIYLRPTNYITAQATVIVNQLTTASTIKFSFGSNLISPRISGFSIYGNGSNAPSSTTTPCIAISGNNLMTRIDHLHFNLVGETDVDWSGWVSGVFDHNVLWNNGYFGVEQNMPTWGGQQNGDGAWAAADMFGTTNFVFLESNTGTNNHSSPGFIDGSSGSGGARFVIRFNAITNWNLGWHGTESSQRKRGTRAYEVYGNTFMYDGTRVGSETWFTCIYVRSGVGPIASNWMYGYDSIGHLRAERAEGGTWPPWGPVDGTNAWDNTGSNIVATGTHTGANAATVLTDANANGGLGWTVNQFIDGYAVRNITQAKAAEVLINSGTTVTYGNTPVTGSGMTFNTGDSYFIAGFITNVLDQPARGIGDLLTNSTTPLNATLGGIIAYPRQVLDPVYEWSNTYIHAPLGNPNKPYLTGDVTVQTNRDYYDNVIMPGWTPYKFPHELVKNYDPNITVQPQGQGVTVGQSAVFSITATGTGTLHYQWKFNGSNVGTDANSYTRSNCQLADTGGSVTCVVTGSGVDSPQTSSAATLTITAPPATGLIIKVLGTSTTGSGTY